MSDPKDLEVNKDDPLMNGLGPVETFIAELRSQLGITFKDEAKMDEYCRRLLAATAEDLESRFPKSTIWTPTMIKAFKHLLMQGALDEYAREADAHARLHLQKTIEFLRACHGNCKRVDDPRYDTQAVIQELKAGQLIAELIRRQASLPEMSLMTRKQIRELRVLGVLPLNQKVDYGCEGKAQQPFKGMTWEEAKEHEARRVRLAEIAREVKQEKKRWERKRKADRKERHEEDRGRRRRRSKAT